MALLQQLDGFVPDSREDFKRNDIATSAAIQLEHLRCGKMEYFTDGVANLCIWVQDIIERDDYLPLQYIYLLEAMLQEDLISREAKTTAEFREAVASLLITLLGIKADPFNALKAQKTICKMRDFCLKLANASGNIPRP